MPDLIVASDVLTTLAEGPAHSGAAVTPHDTDPQPVFRGLWIGGTGNLTVILVNDSTPVTFNNIPNGTLMPLAVKQVMGATTATEIIGLR